MPPGLDDDATKESPVPDEPLDRCPSCGAQRMHIAVHAVDLLHGPYGPYGMNGTPNPNKYPPSNEELP
jgi:hypothetical protein